MFRAQESMEQSAGAGVPSLLLTRQIHELGWALALPPIAVIIAFSLSGTTITPLARTVLVIAWLAFMVLGTLFRRAWRRREDLHAKVAGRDPHLGQAAPSASEVAMLGLAWTLVLHADRGVQVGVLMALSTLFTALCLWT